MPKSLIVYFSQGGTTARVAQSIAKGLRSRDYEIELHNLKDGRPPEPVNYDLLGIGTPVHYFRLPLIVMDYLEVLPHLQNLPSFTFMTYGTYYFDAHKLLHSAFSRKGARITGSFSCHGADLFLGYLKQGFFFSPRNPTNEELAQAENFGHFIGTTMPKRTLEASVDAHSPPFLYHLERFLFNRHLVKWLYSRCFSVDKKSCNSCGVCVKLCPTKNIIRDRENYPVWERNCILCLTCEMKCPQDAISSAVSWPIVRPFLRYNVNRASRDPSLEHVRIIHHGGRIWQDTKNSGAPG